MLRALFLMLRFKSLIRLIGRLTVDRRVPFALKLIVPAGIAYVVSPIDLVPDFVSPFAGRIDDVIAFVLSVGLFLTMAPKEVVLEHSHRIRTGAPPPNSRNGKSPDGNVIEGSYRYADEEENPKS